MKTYALATPVNDKDTWHDGKKHLWVLGLVVPMLPILAIGLYAATGLEVSLWTGPIVMLIIIPIIERLTGTDSTNPPEELADILAKERFYRVVLYAYIPFQYAAFVAAMWVIGTQDISVAGKIGMALTVGVLTGLAINTAHELGHKKVTAERWLAKVALAPTAYGHFYIEHNRGHHVRVSTPEDPASARMGESFYRFWPRTVFGSLRSAWHLEAKRFARRDQHPFRLSNDVINAWLMTVVLWGGLIAWLGVGIVPYLLVQAFLGYSILEIVNYMEHYGMLRQKVGPPDRQRYERCTPAHSWNSNQTVTNVLLYHLQRHSDHHANPTRRYQTLRDFPEAPVLPSGYTGMMVLALIPPLFNRVMNPRVVAHYGGDIRLANLRPSKRAKLLKRYQPPTQSTGAEAAPVDTAVTSPVEAVAAARCPGCSYTYNVADGNELEGFAPGTAWSEIPNDWTCPDCGVREKVDFIPLATATV